MSKALMLSVIAATVAIPALAAREGRPQAAFRWLLLTFGVFCAAYVLVVMFGTPTVVWGE